jgi:AcrR family transcriptional regulator
MTAEVAASENRAQRRASRTRNRLMEAALAMFAEKGISATTIEDITEQADVGKGTFYRHFSTKEAVLEALVEQSLAHLINRLRRTATPSSGSLNEVLNGLLEAHASFHKEHPAEFGLVFQSRRLSRLKESTTAEQQPLTQYLDELTSRLAPFVVAQVNHSKVQSLAAAMAGFVSGFYSLSAIGMTSQEIELSLQPLRQAFIARTSAFLTG